MSMGRRKKTLNLNTYKFHALGDYVETIKMYGTTDSYSTEPVSVISILNGVGLILDRVNWSIAHPNQGIKGRAKKTLLFR